ncbi:MAG: lytic transglycosylase domain-containing protein [Geobacteraceae bacterium]|nr:lytic transglycosylase domain-containing protein [Geobacteraceae bacterium]
MSIRPVDNLSPQDYESSLRKATTVEQSGTNAAFARILATSGAGKNTLPTDPSLATARAELLRLRMMRDALTLQTAPQGTDPSYSLAPSENLLQALASYRTAAGAVSQDSPETASDNAVPVNLPLNSVSATVATADVQVVPKSLADIISKASRRYNVEPGLIKAVIKAESNFNSSAVSPAGARGLMQLMPGTAGDLGVTDSFDPEQNVMAGTRYLRQMLDRYDGNLDSALAAYNWGPGNVDRKGSFLPRETRAYLVKVKSFYSDFVG